jgi:hypothetical protein
MASRSSLSSSNISQHIGSTAASSGGRRAMSTRELQAYLAARDTLRRVRRTSSLFIPPRGDTLHFVVRCRADLPPRDVDA